QIPQLPRQTHKHHVARRNVNRFQLARLRNRKLHVGQQPNFSRRTGLVVVFVVKNTSHRAEQLNTDVFNHRGEPNTRSHARLSVRTHLLQKLFDVDLRHYCSSSFEMCSSMIRRTTSANEMPFSLAT